MLRKIFEEEKKLKEVKSIAKPVLKEDGIAPKRKFLVIDLGLGLDHAIALKERGNEVYYYVAWEEPAPLFNDYMYGSGFGLKKIRDFHKVIDDVDCVMMTDVSLGATADHIRSLGKPVCGCSADGEVLETNRRKAHEIYDQVGIEYPETKNIEGVYNLEKYLEENLDGKTLYFPKINVFRGNLETCGVKDYADAKLVIDRLITVVGPYDNEFEFVVEKEVPDSVEMSFDGWFNGKKFLDQHFFTIEDKHSECTIGKLVDNSEWTPIMKKLEKFLTKSGYAGYFSIEGMWNGKVIKVLDCTCRPPYPVSSVYTKFIKNYDDFIYGVATGKDPKIEIDGKYTVNIAVNSDCSKTNWEIFEFDNDAVRLGVGLRRASKKDGNLYIVPGDQLAYTANAIGNNLNDAFDDVKAVLKGVSVRGDMYDSGIFNTFQEKFVKVLKEKGIEF